MSADKNITPGFERQLLTVQEVVDRTGLSVATVRRRIRAQSLPFLQIGGKNKRILIPITALSPARSEQIEKSAPALLAPQNLDCPASIRPGPMPKWKQNIAARTET
jgi:excisionase family DNA binding protein